MREGYAWTTEAGRSSLVGEALVVCYWGPEMSIRCKLKFYVPCVSQYGTLLRQNVTISF